MVDIDDIFWAPEGRKMKADDVQALLVAQAELRQIIPGFTFNLGFAGGYYGSGLNEEVSGDQELIRNSDKLWWFGQTFRNREPHQMTSVNLLHSMKLNREFAKNHSLPALLHRYSVSPNYSGVYPTHTPLYEAWKKVWNTTVTTTDLYPHFKSEHKRKGFIHKGIRVLPRHSCHLFPYTYLTTHFVGGRDELLAIAQGGEVFMTLLHNPISIFVTHTPNYPVTDWPSFSSLQSSSSYLTGLNCSSPLLLLRRWLSDTSTCILSTRCLCGLPHVMTSVIVRSGQPTRYALVYPLSLFWVLRRVAPQPSLPSCDSIH
jgi:hypothetical protein